MSRFTQAVTVVAISILVAIYVAVHLDRLSFMWYGPWWAIIFGLPVFWACDFAVRSIRKALPELRRELEDCP
jgi:hypothetical protein